MDQKMLEEALAGLPLGGLRYLDQTGSTNDKALEWALQGAPDLALVVADEQTQGRGRAGRTWQTVPGAALAFSLVLTPASTAAGPPMPRLTALGTLAVHTALTTRWQLPAQVKWPNDVLIEGQKVAGILAEGHWLGESVQTIVLGIGVNITPAAVPPPSKVNFPATSLEDALGRPVNRAVVLRHILVALLHWRPLLEQRAFLQAWEGALAYLGEQVQVELDSGKRLAGQLLGLDPQGFLKLRTADGEQITTPAGEMRLRPA
jgi:BirA family biotin operon repressor/biotin-[acetyl-CoA-carboxylase] ligase